MQKLIRLAAVFAASAGVLGCAPVCNDSGARDRAPFFVSYPKWSAKISPDGTEVAVFTSDRLAIYTIGARQWRDLPMSGTVAGVAFSPDNKNMAVTAYDGTGSRFRLFERKSDHITFGSFARGVFLAGIAFAPDASRVAFTARCEGGCPEENQTTQIAILELPNGDDPRVSDFRFVKNSNPVLDVAPLWLSPRFSSDSTMLTYGSRSKSLFAQLAVASVAGTNAFQQYVSDGYSLISPAGFTSDGDALFLGMCPQGETKVAIEDALLKKRGHRTSSCANLPYRAASSDKKLTMEIFDPFDVSAIARLTCAADCSKAVWVAPEPNSNSYYLFNLFYGESGTARQVTNFHTAGLDVEVADFAANGRWAVVTTVGVPFYTGPCRVTRPANDASSVVVIDIENNKTIDVPVADLEKAG